MTPEEKPERSTRPPRSEPDLAGAMLPPPAALLRDPLAFIAAEHGGQRALCSMMENLAGAATVDRAVACEIVRYLRGDLARHVHDEEGDLFPLLRKRCLAEDEIGTILGRLNAEHSDETGVVEDIATGLENLVAQKNAVLDEKLRAQLFRYARSMRRHLAMENSIILPLARARLTPADLKTLSRSMTRRYSEDRTTTRSGK